MSREVNYLHEITKHRNDTTKCFIWGSLKAEPETWTGRQFAGGGGVIPGSRSEGVGE